MVYNERIQVVSVKNSGINLSKLVSVYPDDHEGTGIGLAMQSDDSIIIGGCAHKL